MRFEGIYTPIVTPHRDDHSIDRDRFAEVAEHLIAAGVHGIVLAGTTGEYYAQSTEERVALMGLAKAAELNHGPGPQHVLERAEARPLKEKQRSKTQAIFATMRQQD